MLFNQSHWGTTMEVREDHILYLQQPAAPLPWKAKATARTALLRSLLVRRRAADSTDHLLKHLALNKWLHGRRNFVANIFEASTMKALWRMKRWPHSSEGLEERWLEMTGTPHSSRDEAHYLSKPIKWRVWKKRKGKKNTCVYIIMVITCG